MEEQEVDPVPTSTAPETADNEEEEDDLPTLTWLRRPQEQESVAETVQSNNT